MSHQAEFVKAVKALSHRHHAWKIFEDYCEMHALALAQPFMVDADKALWDKREARYLDIVRQYETEEVHKLCQLSGMVTMAMEETQGDILGPAFEELELASKWHGQFFTPYHLCRAIGEMTLDAGAEDIIRERGYMTVGEPACGAGAMVIAMAKVLLDRGHNPQRCMYVVATDKSPVAAHMCFIQLSLLGIPAVVHRGNTLTLEIEESFLTPMHWMGYWAAKLRWDEMKEGASSEAVVLPPEAERQLNLFEAAG